MVGHWLYGSVEEGQARMEDGFPQVESIVNAFQRDFV